MKKAAGMPADQQLGELAESRAVKRGRGRYTATPQMVWRLRDDGALLFHDRALPMLASVRARARVHQR